MHGQAQERNPPSPPSLQPSPLTPSHPTAPAASSAPQQLLPILHSRNEHRRCKMTKSFLSMCAGPLLLALAASASTSSSYKYPSENSPSNDTSAGGNSTSSDDSEGGTIIETYDDYVAAAGLLPDACEFNTYMCCWTGHEGSANMTGNADVCRVLDYPTEGDSFEMPRDQEGRVYCHGFAWPNGADVVNQIMPLFQHVKNVHSEEGGRYYGSVEGAPECGCIEDMPIVDDAACSMFTHEGIAECYENSLHVMYKYVFEEPKGPIDFNLIRQCDNTDVPDFDFRTCEQSTYMCCWTENDGTGMADNTDVCRVVDYPTMGRTAEYPGESEGEVHCHGFVWPPNETDRYIHGLAQYVQHFDHRDYRGYFGNVEGAPMCGCLEEMPIVSRADCTTYENVEERQFTGCTDNDLRTRYLEEFPQGKLSNLVEECDNAAG